MSKRLPTIEDCCGQERFLGGDWHAGRGAVAVTSSRAPGVRVRDLSTGETRVITAPGGSGESYARFSPDGSRVLFLASFPGRGRQVCVCDADTGALLCQSDINGAATEPQWSPDGRRILFASSQGSEGKRQKGRPDEAVVIEDFHYKVEGAGFIRPDGHVQLFLMDAATGDTRQLTEGQHDWMHHAWSPDGRTIVSAGNLNRSRQDAIGFDLYLMDVDAAEPAWKQLSRGLMIVSYPNPVRPVFTPDGSAVLMCALGSNPYQGYPPAYMYRFPVDGGEAACVFEPDTDCYQCVQFPYNAFCGWGMDKMQVDPDTGDLYFLAGWEGQCVIYRLAPGKTRAERFAGGPQACHGLGRIQRGRMLAALSESDRPEYYVVYDLGTGERETVAQSCQELLEQVTLSRCEDFFFQTLDGESRVHGFVFPPANREPGKKYPTVLYIHGGPHPFYTYGCTMEFQALNGAGFGVICCNPRGTSGYGAKHQNMARAYDGSAFTDCLQFVEEAVRRFDWIDGERIGATGGSYGGYMVNWMATHCERFRAYIAQRAVSSEMISYASSDMNGQSREFASFEEFMVRQVERSPVAFAERVNRPFLILHGEDDYRVPVEEAHQMFIAVKDTHPDLPVRLVIFPHVCHDQPSEPSQLRRYYREMHDWFRAYL